MITIQNGRIQAVLSRMDRIGSLVYDGKGFALTSPSRAGVTRLDQALRPVETVRTDRHFLCLCYDTQERCYWASADGSPMLLYQLDTTLHEIGRLELFDSRVQRLCGISCDPVSGALTLCYPDAVAQVDKTSGKCGSVVCPSYSQQNLGVLALSGGYLRAFGQHGRQYIEVQSRGCGAPVVLYIPEEFSMEAMVLHATRRGQGQAGTVYEVGVLLSQRMDGALVMVQTFVTCSEGEGASRSPIPLCASASPRLSTSPSAAFPLRPLAPPCPPKPPCSCDSACSSTSPCSCDSACSSTSPCSCDSACSQMPPCSCDSACSPKPPCPPWPPVPPCPPKPPCSPARSCQCGKYEIMHSIALQEAGLAHILNAEGEKLQKVVAESTSVEQLLCVNESVRRTITQITQLEGQLYAKLDSLTHICDCDEDTCVHKL